jgi:hypothetical protein
VRATLVARSLALGLALAACPHAVVSLGCSPSRDVIPESRDVRGASSADATAPAQKDGYVFVARRPHGAVGLVGARAMSDDDAHRLVDRIADDLEACARRLEARSGLVEGALQLVAITGPHGNAEITDVRFAPGGPVAANALECIVAPLRASPFPAGTDAGVPALALEATWAPNRSGKPDSGSPL